LIAAASTQVLIVGGGPCGLTLSIELGRRGIASLLVDAKDGTAVNPQANATQARTMEHFRRLGFAHEVRALGLPQDYPTDITYFTRYADRELARFPLPTSAQAAAHGSRSGTAWSSAELPHRASQKFVETVLRRHAEACAPSAIRFGTRLVSFEEHDDRVEATIEDVASGATSRVVASFLVGADGAKSTVRRQLGVRYAGETGVTRDFFGGRMAAVYFRAPGFYDAIPHPRAWMYWAFNPQRRSWLAAVNGIDEFAFHTQIRPGEDERIDAARARELLAQAVGKPLDIEILALDTWIAGHALVAEGFGGGRVFIGGDAAHLFTPAGGLGYNTAVEDAVNLGWKLAATLKGAVGPALLSSYGVERRMLAIRNTGYARAFAESIGNFVPDPAIESEGPDGDRARAAAGEYLNAHARREFDIPGVTFGGRYDGSPVIVADGTTPPPDAANIYIPSASPGGRLPHLWREGGRSLFDDLGFEWTLLSMGVDDGSIDAFTKAASKRGVELAVLRLGEPGAADIYGADLLLVRPDQIVAWRGANHDCDPEAIFDQVLGFGAAAMEARPRSAVA